MTENKKWLNVVSEFMDEFQACNKGYKMRYLRRHKSFRDAWRSCENTNWMAWLFSELSGQYNIDKSDLNLETLSYGGIPRYKARYNNWGETYVLRNRAAKKFTNTGEGIRELVEEPPWPC